jgi:RHS repeat-associated protein
VLSGQGERGGGYLQSRALSADGRFPTTDVDDAWWIPSGQSFFTPDAADPAAAELAAARRHFFLPRRYRDAFGQEATVSFDRYDLLLIETRDALSNRVTVEINDYRVLQPCLVSDPNRNQAAAAFDILGMVVGTAAMGKPLPAIVEGDSLTGFVTDPATAEREGLFDADPHAWAPSLLQSASTRIVYDLDRFRRTRQAHPNDPAQWQPACAATLARETHASAPRPPEGLRVQIAFSYSDGFGREIQKKIQAERGAVLEHGPRVERRWVSSGWTIFNNKSKPIRQYEPFFSATHFFEFGVTVGVSPILFYDPMGRVVATLHPNNTYEKVLFDPWGQTTYDVNDTVAPHGGQTGDPRTDSDVKGYMEGYFRALSTATNWQTWYAQRIGGALGSHERNAAAKAEAHADTPTTAHYDVLGRSFLTVARNRIVCAGHALDGSEEQFSSRIELDIEGNQRTMRDAINRADPLGRVIVRYAYDMIGNRIYQLNLDAGARWTLADATANPLRSWDSRGHNFTHVYDPLRRPSGQYVRGTTGDSDPRIMDRDVLVDRTVYGEAVREAESLNLRTRIYKHFDSAGVVTSARLTTEGDPLEAYDFKGNQLHSTRRFVRDYTEVPNWQLSPLLEDEFFASHTSYDALNRPSQLIAPRSSLVRGRYNVIQPVFNEANLLERIDVWLEHGAEPTALLNPAIDASDRLGVSYIDYNAKGQRLRIDYKNGATTFYEHDSLTFRLKSLTTRRDPTIYLGDCPRPPPNGWPGCQVQNLHYTYDPIGNITHIEDDAQQALYFRNKRVEPDNDYIYDAIYRLIQATGREHLGQGGAPIPHSHDDAGRVGLISVDAAGLFGPNDGNAMGAYTERYVYDAVGNLLEMQHRGCDLALPGWTRHYTYAENSLVDRGSAYVPTEYNNRLFRTTLNPGGGSPASETYEHDQHGNVVRMPHLGGGRPGRNMEWDYNDRLRLVDLGGGGRAFYVYDASGLRVRKIWKKAPGLTEEYLYVGVVDLLRRQSGAHDATVLTFERETLQIMDDKQRIALVETRTIDGVGESEAPRRLVRFEFGNHLGSAILELDHNAHIISYEEFSAYGSSTYQAVRSQKEATKRFRYTGKERDEETGLNYHGARYYAVWLGRWIACDPAGFRGGGTNLYEYTNSRPSVLIDPSGREGNKPPVNSPRDVVDFEARQAAFEAGARLQRGEVKATRGGQELPPPTGEQLNKIAADTPEGKELRLKYATKQGIEAGQTLKENVTARSAAASVRSKEIPNFGEASGKIVPEVGFNEGKIISAGKNPGGEPAGARTADLGIAKQPVTPENYGSLKGQAGSDVFEASHDVKLGAGRVADKPGFRAASGGVSVEEVTPGTRGLRLPKGAGTVTLNAAGAALIAVDALNFAREQRIAEQSPGRAGVAVLEDANGQYKLEIRRGIIFNDYYKTYISGPQEGTSVELGFFEFRREIKKRDEKYGYFDWKGDFVQGKVPPIIVPAYHGYPGMI